MNLTKIQLPNLKKKSWFAEPEIFLGFEIDLDIQISL
jgi:hypothetical protein